MAFVVVSHQAPTGRSLLTEILSKTTAMPVQEIAGDTRALAKLAGTTARLRGGSPPG